MILILDDHKKDLDAFVGYVRKFGEGVVGLPIKDGIPFLHRFTVDAVLLMHPSLISDLLQTCTALREAAHDIPILLYSDLPLDRRYLNPKLDEVSALVTNILIQPIPQRTMILIALEYIKEHSQRDRLDMTVKGIRVEICKKNTEIYGFPFPLPNLDFFVLRHIINAYPRPVSEEEITLFCLTEKNLHDGYSSDRLISRINRRFFRVLGKDFIVKNEENFYIIP